MNRGRGGERGEKEERRKGEPLGIHQYFDAELYNLCGTII